tara:strand:- start:17757 stop:18167 length:411 start_codon:yes stop_codon:yes gene_type:complete
VDQKEVECLSLNIYWESKGESRLGQFAVALVTLNRVDHQEFPGSVCEVVYQGIHKDGFPIRDRCQFSWYCDSRSDIPRDRQALERASEIAEFILISHKWLPDLSEGSLFYHANNITPWWSGFKKKTMQIDNHIFYR